MSEIKFFMAMLPPTVTHQEKQVHVVNGRPMFYEPTELKAARAKLTDTVGAFKPDIPFAGPVQLITKWIYPMGTKYQDGAYKTTKPDTDNMIKLLKDCMTRTGFWDDDAQVASEITEKFWGKQPGIFVVVRQL